MSKLETNLLPNVTVLPESMIYHGVDQLLPPGDVFKKQGDLHEEIDTALVDRIDNYLFPILGDYGSNGQWHHSMMCNMDGIRALSIDYKELTNKLVVDLQKMLCGAAKDFTIFINVHDDFLSENDSRLGTILILGNKIIISEELEGFGT